MIVLQADGGSALVVPTHRARTAISCSRVSFSSPASAVFEERLARRIVVRVDLKNAAPALEGVGAISRVQRRVREVVPGELAAGIAAHALPKRLLGFFVVVELQQIRPA